MTISKSFLGTLSTLSILLASVNSYAYDAGDWIIHLGVASVQPNDSSSTLELNGTALAGVKAEVDDSTQIGLTITYMLNSNWGIELLAATPFKHDIYATGLEVKAASTKQLPPTLSLQYYPMSASSDFQPYVGVGLNYTIFFDETVDGELKSALGTDDIELDLSSSLGLAAQIGVNFAIGEKVLLNASIWYADIDTEATFDVAGTSEITADVQIDPWVFMFSIGYKI